MIVGLTGGIGSGKTTVAKVFGAMGCLIYNSDERAKEIYFEKHIKQLVVNLLGEKAYLNQTTLNKEFISSQIFSSEALRQQLNQIIHPAVKQDFEMFKASISKNKTIIKETALLFEADLQSQVDASVLVTAPTSVKINRVMKRSLLSKSEIENRMSSQWADEKKIPLSDFVIMNDGIEPLIPQVEIILNKINT
jgi:dephospho-CoA kinase